MSEDANIWKIIRDLGVFVSVLAAAIGYWVRIRSEQKKVIKRVLFHLLEIRYKARFLAPPSKESIKAFTQRYYASLNEKQIDLEKEIPEEVLQAVIEHVIGQAMLDRSHFSPDFSKNFRSSINQLAETYPRLAFLLHESDELGLLLSRVDELNSEVLTKLSLNDDGSMADDLPSLLQSISREGRRFNIARNNEGIDLLIRALSKKCGFREWSRNKKLLKLVHDDTNNLSDEEMDAICEIVVKLFDEHEVSLNESEDAPHE